MPVQTRPEPMNASPHHSKVKVTLTLGQSTFVAGEHVAGKMEIECRADKGLGIGVIMVELFGIEELTSRDHSATSTFIHGRRLFQGPGLPPSNAVQPYPSAGDPPVPRDYHQARRGFSTFLFRFDIPPSSPSAISFGSGLARVKYEVRASVAVAWKGEKRLVTDKKEIDVVESFERDFTRPEPQGVIIGENGKLWVQGRVVGGMIVSGESGCVELQVKNHSHKKNTGLTVTLTRNLHLPGFSRSQEAPLRISDTLTTVPFRGQEYIVPPGVEGVASLVFDVPMFARGVKGGTRDGDEAEHRTTEALFEVRCIVGIKMLMGIGSKDICLDLPVTIVHPSAMPELPAQEHIPVPAPYPYPHQYTPPMMDVPVVAPLPTITPALPFSDRAQSPYLLTTPPPLQPFIHQEQVWLPPPPHFPLPPHGLPAPYPNQDHYLQAPMPFNHPRPSSAGALVTGYFDVSGQQLLPFDMTAQQVADAEEGKGERASRIAQHLHLSSRNRSVSPQSHRFPLPASHSSPIAIPTPTSFNNLLPIPGNLSPITSPSIPIQSQGMVHSPRPLLSPKQSFSIDPVTHNSVPKSLRVEELERMAEELNIQDLSSDLPQDLPEPKSYPDKTLPPPPVPSSKPKRYPPASTPRHLRDILDAEKTPPTPTLTAVMPSKQLRTDTRLVRGESGLDALERRLLAEVGTRKFELGERRRAVGGALPIAIPSPNAQNEPLHDSAISSLTLAEHDFDEHTQKPAKSTVSGDDREVHERGRGQALPPLPPPQPPEPDQGDKRVGRPRKGKKKERENESDAAKFRKAAKSRVAAWLGGIDADALPPDTPPIQDFTESPSEGSGQPTTDPPPLPPSPAVAPRSPDHDTPSKPNPRSSGFVPINTVQGRPSLSRSTLEPDLIIHQPEELTAIPSTTTTTPKPTHKPIAQRVPLPTPTEPQNLSTDRAISPPSTSQGALANGSPKLRPARPKPVRTLTSYTPVAKRGPDLPSRLDPEVKYDFRSARGGRGGQVAAVAAMWAKAVATSQDEDKDKDKPKVVLPKHRFVPLTKPNPPPPPPKTQPSVPSGPTKLIDLSRNPARPVVKSLSVPAVVSSSHATPTLSSTASLARPPPVTPVQRNPMIRPSPSMPEVSSNRTSPGKPVGNKPPGGELAFGQARLRDLIKKYQGPTS